VCPLITFIPTEKFSLISFKRHAFGDYSLPFRTEINRIPAIGCHRHRPAMAVDVMQPIKQLDDLVHPRKKNNNRETQ
jgi:hypothetical protein